VVDEPHHRIPISANWVLERIQGGKDVRLKNAIIKGDLIVDKTTMPKKNRISSIFSQIKITNSQIEGMLSFAQNIFKKPVDFSGSEFSAKAYFDQIAFEGEANFDRTKFIDQASFGETNFNGITYFTGAIFSGDAIFGYAKFSRYADFSRAKFSRKTIFSAAVFRDFAGFEGATFNGIDEPARFITTFFSGATGFNGATFSGEADFNGARFDNIVNFGAIFHKRLNFENSKIYLMRLSRATINSTISLKFSEFNRLEVRWAFIRGKIEYDGTAYLSLVKNFNNLELFSDADECYYQYRTLRRKEHLKGIIPKLLDYVAWIVYGYGVRPGNPLILSLSLFLISVFIFASGFGLQEPLGSIMNATYLSMFVFTSSPKTDPLTGFYGIWGMIERIAGWLLMACFLVVLAKKTLR
jgi:uncharacterized protein YjbI with pentapeptide repeats